MIRFTLRMPGELHAHLKTAAERDQRSLHGQILWILSHYCEPSGVNLARLALMDIAPPARQSAAIFSRAGGTEDELRERARKHFAPDDR